MPAWRQEKSIGKRRVGTLVTKSGGIHTPFFMPIATRGAVKHIAPDEVRALGAEIVLGNTYHLWLRPGSELIARAGGLHRFMDWTGPILTDSGGFQVFSLGPARNASPARSSYANSVAGGRSDAGGCASPKSNVRITEEGVEFVDYTNGNRHFLSPEISIDIQLDLGSDIIMVLDECPPYPCTREYALASLERTSRWARRAFEHFYKKIKEHGEKYASGRPLLFCIVQGSIYQDLRIESAKQLSGLDFAGLGGPASGWDGYAIGGVAVGEPRETLPDILAWTVPHLPEDKPRYLMGLGKPEELVMAVNAGMDMFDCVIPTREGRHGRLFIWNEQSEFPISNPPAGRAGFQFQNEEWKNFYQTINIQNERFKEDFSPVDPSCDCLLCTRYTRAYLRHLFAVGEPLAGRLASLHNLRFYMKLMELLRECTV
ncbi:MAG: tRNA guanosine(34) transglycosylase Tgt [Patescibacteria group bacterium]